MKPILITILLCIMFLFSACGQEPAPEPSELNTPQYTLSSMPEKIDLSVVPKEEIHGGGSVKVIEPTSEATPVDAIAGAAVDPEAVWAEDETVSYNAFTLPEKAALDESGCIGILTVPKLELTVNVYEAEDEMEAMTKGAAHFKSTSAWDGNVGVSAHNVNFNGTDGYFKNLYKLKAGDTITYETAIGIRNYTVTKVKSITADDWSSLSRSAANRLTLVTCISGQADRRLVVQASQK